MVCGGALLWGDLGGGTHGQECWCVWLVRRVEVLVVLWAAVVVVGLVRVGAWMRTNGGCQPAVSLKGPSEVGREKRVLFAGRHGLLGSMACEVE